jgi:hypothetical protein
MRSSRPSRSRAPIRRDRQLRARAQIDQRFFDTPYYITPNAPVGQEAFAVIREAMRGKPLLAPRGVNSPSPARLAEIRLTVWATGATALPPVLGKVDNVRRQGSSCIRAGKSPILGHGKFPEERLGLGQPLGLKLVHSS